MWKWYFLALMLTARLAVYCCEEPASATGIPAHLSNLMKSSPVCPPKLPLLDFIRMWEDSAVSPDLSAVKEWATAAARRYPGVFSVLAVLGVLEQIAENLFVVYVAVNVVKKVVEGLAQSLCCILAIAIGVGLLAYAANSREHLWLFTQHIVSVVTPLLEQ